MLDLIAGGATQKEIMYRLGIRYYTLKSYFNELYRKFGVSSSPALVRRAFELNIFGGGLALQFLFYSPRQAALSATYGVKNECPTEFWGVRLDEGEAQMVKYSEAFPTREPTGRWTDFEYRGIGIPFGARDEEEARKYWIRIKGA